MSAGFEAAAIVLSVRAFDEGHAIVSILTADHGLSRGMVRGGASRAHAATWQAGNVVAARWVARLADQLGTLTGELAYAGAASAMTSPLALGVLSAAASVIEATLPEREPHAKTFAAMLDVIGQLASDDLPARYVRLEATLLGDLGYGLDFSGCALGGEGPLAYVSPKTGRAVSAAAAGAWREKLLPLPAFLLDDSPGDARAWADGLRLTERFLLRDALGVYNRGLPDARIRLRDRIEAMDTPNAG